MAIIISKENYKSTRNLKTMKIIFHKIFSSLDGKMNFYLTTSDSTFPCFKSVTINSFLSFLCSNRFEVNFYKVVLIIICKHLEHLGDYKPIFTSPSAQ